MKEEYAVLSTVGPDRKGMADDIANIAIDYNCNIEDSKMAVLGGEFAVIMLLSGEESSIEKLISMAGELGERFQMTFNIKKTSAPLTVSQGIPYILESVSMDTPGIVHAITRYLRELSINIEDLETEKSAAPLSGTPMFHMRAYIVIPASVNLSDFREKLADIEHEKNLDIHLKALRNE
ncbi:MAG: amino acid-binding protein [Spirochaetales bacterium]|nr:amino acid-binding protein [Spirochaetales bacterium]